MRFFYAVFILLFVTVMPAVSYAAYSGGSDGGPNVGIAFGGAGDVDTKICPQGVQTVKTFLASWANNDYEVMYSLYTDESKENYPLTQARLDFSILEYKEYEIISIRRRSDGNFEFIISYGDWKDGNKDSKKLIIDGKTFLIVKSSPNSPFKVSAADYF
ncbi:MAG TPA: hypothetical protein PKY78_05745 [Candidatus Omnitrophota bacterium]|nr:hypothetical protein [Candidatus Omnitrophota bacterium]